MSDFFKVGSKIGNYQLIERINSGCFGTTFKAKDNHDKVVALKIISKPFYTNEKFEIESNALSRVNSPFVIGFIESNFLEYRGERFHYIVTDFAGGGTLTERIPTVSKDQALSIIYDVLDAVSEIHKVGVLHCDLKPDNILFDGDRIKAIDFGISHLSVNEISAYRSTDFTYMAPEFSKGLYSVQGDIWSVGVLLVKLLTNSVESPFKRRGDIEDKNTIKKRIYNTDIEDSLKTVILKALNVDRRLRYKSADEFKIAIKSTFINSKEIMRIEQGYEGWDYDGFNYPSRSFTVKFDQPFKNPPILQLSVVMIDSWPTKEGDKGTRYSCHTKEVHKDHCIIEIVTWNESRISGAKIQWSAIGE